MPRPWLCLLLALALPLLLAAASPQPADLGLGTYRALIIGVQDYDASSGIPDLKTPEADAQALGELLEERYGFTDVRLLTGAQATRAGVLGAMAELRGAAGPDDAVLVYFAGHGVRDDAKQQGYWLPSDALRGNTANWISNADVRDEFKAMPARHVLVISDACFSGSLIGTRDLNAAEVVGDLAAARRLAGKQSRWVLTSGGDEPVLDEHLSSGHSVFAYYLLQVLGEQRDPYVNLGAFLDTLEKRVVNNAPQTPEAAPLRMAGDDGGQLVLVNQASGAVQAAEPASPAGGVIAEALAPLPGAILVTVKAGGEVSLDGLVVGSVVPWGRLDLQGVSPGPHVVAVGGEQQAMEVTPGETVQVELAGAPTVPAAPTEPVEVLAAAAAPIQPEAAEHASSAATPAALEQIDWVAIPGQPFEIARSEVTVAQYRACVEAGACEPPCGRRGGTWERVNRPRLPVNCVDAERAAAFAAWAGGRLPTEEEWRIAARGGAETVYAGSDVVAEVAWTKDDSEGRVRVVCQKQPNGYGLCDLSGNLWEWTATREGDETVYLGGSWNHSPKKAMVAERSAGDGGMCGDDLGIRIVRDAP